MSLYSFEPQEIIRSARLNANFEGLADGSLIQNGAIGPSKRAGGFYAGQFTISASGSKAVTGVGFQPKGIIFWAGLSQGSSAASFFQGSTDGTNQNASMKVTRFTTTDGTDSDNWTDSCIRIYGMSSGGVASAQIIGTITSLDSDGFTLNITTYTASNVINFMAFG